jgi:hypothetical protein
MVLMMMMKDGSGIMGRGMRSAMNDAQRQH